MTGTSISPQLLDLIGAIYDSVLEPSRWEATMVAINAHLRMTQGTLAVNSLDSGLVKSSYEVAHGFSAAIMQRIVRDYGAEVVALWGGPAKVLSVPLEEPRRQSDMGERPIPQSENPYARDILVPHGIIDGLAVALEHGPRMIANAAFGRHKSEGPIGDEEIDALRVLAPHLRRATAISGLLNTTLSQVFTFASALDASPTAIVICDAEMNVIHANERAKAVSVAGDPIRIVRGVVSLREPLISDQLEAAVAACSTDEATGRRGLGVPAKMLDGSSALVQVLPLERRSWRPDIAQRATAALFISETAEPVRLPTEIVALRYSLTPAETRVMEQVVAGKTLPEIASDLGNSRHTVRTHLNRVFDKTGCHRQAELVRLLSTNNLSA